MCYLMIRVVSGMMRMRNLTLLIRDHTPEDRFSFSLLFDTLVTGLVLLILLMQCLVWACRACKRRAVSFN